MRVEIGKIIPIKSFVKEPFYIKGLDCDKFKREENLPNFTIYFSNDKEKLRNTISGKQPNEWAVAHMRFKGGGRPANLYLPELDKRWPVYNFCYLHIDRLTDARNVYVLFEMEVD